MSSLDDSTPSAATKERVLLCVGVTVISGRYLSPDWTSRPLVTTSNGCVKFLAMAVVGNKEVVIKAY